MEKILDEQALDDLALLYHDTKNRPNVREFFWSVLECVGCSSEFDDYWENNKADYDEDDE